MRLRDLLRAKPPASAWCGPPPQGTVGRATRVGERCAISGSPLERAAPQPNEAAHGSLWRCPHCATGYHEPDAVR